LTNQITGPETATVTVAGALVIVPGQPLSLTVYVNVTLPTTPGGGSKSNVPVAAFRPEIVPPTGLVALTPATLKVGVQPLIPVSASVTPASSPVKPTIFMLAWAAKFLACATGASLTALTVMVTIWIGDSLSPPSAVPPLSVIFTETVAAPFWFAAGV
jgi:hypothetical protein